jgi:glycosyltransferase involved in cell wall biosynthesis
MAKSTRERGEYEMYPKIAVAIPCYNEEATITKVIRDFKRVLPEASIYVFNNNSTDKSAELAKAAGAVVYFVGRQGKGNVIRAIFDTIVADALIVVDGDDTYFAEEAPLLLAPILQGEADMVVGDRLKKARNETFVQLHRIGNYIIVKAINLIFGTSYEDILSGYRVFSRRFVQFVPLLAPGFETEAELTLQALEEGLKISEIPISYTKRLANSSSKLRPFRDGWRIMMTAAMLLRDHQPLRIYGFIGIVCFAIVLVAGLLRLMNYYGITTLPSTILTGIILLLTPISMLILGIGLMLSAVNTRLREIKQIMMRNK